MRQALVAVGRPVRPVSRRDGLDLSRLCRPADWLPLLEGVDAVVNAAGIIAPARGQSFEQVHERAPQALFEACAQQRVRRVVQISALGADGRAVSAFHRSKRAADDALRRSPLDAAVLRPSLVHGPGGASAAWLSRLARWPRLVAIGDGGQPLQPVHVDDLVACVMRGIDADTVPRTLDVVGPQVFTWLQWLAALRAAQGLPPAPALHLPPGLVQRLAVLAQAFSPLLRPDNLGMLEAGNVGDVLTLSSFLGRPPRPVLPATSLPGRL